MQFRPNTETERKAYAENLAKLAGRFPEKAPIYTVVVVRKRA